MTEQEKFERVKELINQIADSFGSPSEEEVSKMNALTGMDWESEDVEMICCNYWESPFTLDEVAYFMIHGEHRKNTPFSE